ncbi:protein CHUP1, chloroplastic-like [Hordeum vulgare]|uniref:protein CHUP1, chloroplastic-like n=1 Tax=Hordeum vulgare subsp. vulgare TaxID=112509 RepID=UPI001B84C22A|nr:protein CHUP1, chloroplastic-like [Hordeum vulgare subsp. vulgare]KAE8807557.1 protein CHUP1, chloroplastic-like [Hordeum vulgare]
MVAGRVKAAMGFQRSPATPKTSSTTSSRKAPTPAPSQNTAPAPAAAARPQTPTPGRRPAGQCSPAPPSSGGKGGSFARSFGVYFPRSSAQVQPARAATAPDAAELARLVEELQERESRLRTELLEHKILKETVVIVPFLETELAAKSSELGRCRDAMSRLQAENARLRAELDAALANVSSKEQRIAEMEGRMAEMARRQRGGRADDCSSSDGSMTGGGDTAAKPASKPVRPPPPPPPPPPPMPTHAKPKSYFSGSSRASPANSSSSGSSTLSCSSDTAASTGRKPELSKLPPIPPPPPPPPPSMPTRATRSASSSPSTSSGAAPAPPPPPPPPPPSGPCVRRVPEVVEFYHSLMRRDSKRDCGGGACPESGSTGGSGAANARDMIGEIENRSSHLIAIRSDVERQGDFIRFLIKEVEGAAFADIDDVVTFVKWLDVELSRLVDERAVLKHFDWPEQKADALREAAFGYRDLKKVEAEAASFCDDPRQPCASALKKMQALFEKLEHGVYSLSRVRDGAMNRYRGYQIPWEWMQDTGIVSQIKIQSVKLARKYLRRVSSELEATQGGPDEEELMLQGVRFAFRVHQFAGGFDGDTMRAFQEIKEKANALQSQRDQQHLQQQSLTAGRS